MRTVLADLWDRLRTSLWFIPSLMAAASVLLAFVMVRVQEWIDDEWMYGTRWLATGDPAGARQILSTIAGSIITVTGVIFSVTLVALSLASQQFGPRLLRTFMRDRGNQFVLGIFIGTFIYSMLVLRVIQESDDDVNIPYLAVTLAVAMALLALTVLIYFIHHVVASIQADTLILNVSRELHSTMKVLYPHEHEEVDANNRSMLRDEESRLPPPRILRASKTGYVRALAIESLLEIAEKHNAVVRVIQRPGRFVIDGQAIAQVHSEDEINDDRWDSITHHIRESVIIGPARTAEQDIEFSIAQLVEVALRSLSPSLNDPFTAMACLDRLGEAIVHLGRRELPKTQRCESKGKLRLLIDRPDFAGMVDLSFDQIRQNSRGKPAVIIRMLDVIGAIIENLRNRPNCFEALLKHAAMLTATIDETVAEENDRIAIRERYEEVRAMADQASQSQS